MHEFVGFNMSEHELITLVRHYRIDDKGHPWEPKEDMHALIQMELKRINFLNFDSLAKALAEKEASLLKEPTGLQIIEPKEKGKPARHTRTQDTSSITLSSPTDEDDLSMLTVSFHVMPKLLHVKKYERKTSTYTTMLISGTTINISI